LLIPPPITFGLSEFHRKRLLLQERRGLDSPAPLRNHFEPTGTRKSYGNPRAAPGLVVLPGAALFQGSRKQVSDADKYRRFAQECVELADQTENTQAKAKLLEMAEHWLQLAMETARASTLTHVRGRIGCRRFSHVAAFCNRRERT
jgi:hypothetical protein